MEKEELQRLTDDIVQYTFEKVEEKLEEFKIEFHKELSKQIKAQTEEILIGNSKIADRIIADILKSP